jgi:GT2 family glycosyltransferase
VASKAAMAISTSKKKRRKYFYFYFLMRIIFYIIQNRKKNIHHLSCLHLIQFLFSSLRTNGNGAEVINMIKKNLINSSASAANANQQGMNMFAPNQPANRLSASNVGSAEQSSGNTNK